MLIALDEVDGPAADECPADDVADNFDSDDEDGADFDVPVKDDSVEELDLPSFLLEDEGPPADVDDGPVDDFDDAPRLDFAVELGAPDDALDVDFASRLPEEDALPVAVELLLPRLSDEAVPVETVVLDLSRFPAEAEELPVIVAELDLLPRLSAEEEAPEVAVLDFPPRLLLDERVFDPVALDALLPRDDLSVEAVALESSVPVRVECVDESEPVTTVVLAPDTEVL